MSKRGIEKVDGVHDEVEKRINLIREYNNDNSWLSEDLKKERNKVNNKMLLILFYIKHINLLKIEILSSTDKPLLKYIINDLEEKRFEHVKEYNDMHTKYKEKAKQNDTRTVPENFLKYNHVCDICFINKPFLYNLCPYACSMFLCFRCIYKCSKTCPQCNVKLIKVELSVSF